MARHTHIGGNGDFFEAKPLHKWPQVWLYIGMQGDHPMLKEILIRVLIALGLIAFTVIRTLNNVFRRS